MTDGESAGSTAVSIRNWPLPADLATVVVLVVAGNIAVLAPVLNESPLRIVLGLLFVLVLPGYAVVAALFPGAGDVATSSDGTVDTTRGIDGIERTALSVALSIPVVALLGLGLSLTPLGVTLPAILPTISLVTLAATATATRRRARLPADQRFHVPYRAWLATGRDAFQQPASRTDLLVNIVLAVSILLAVGSVTYAVAAPNEGEAFTEFYLLTENETGELVADGYPTTFNVGEPQPVVVGIENHEQHAIEYTVLIQLQRVQVDGNATSVVATERLDRFTVALDDDETWREPRSIAPTTTGGRLRIVFLLYRDTPPDDPSVENAYRNTQLWVSVAKQPTTR
jgi:uncharacterized membrane protein